MNEELLIELMQKINDEQIQHGTCEIKFTFHDGIIEFYELTTHKRTNVNLCGTGMNKKERICGDRKPA
ncbi:MAG: hypothetical protein II232_08095 [Spirochaetaceae bacterium]|nr:hypothetical protein [Spirochaetaceae bacterium]